MIVVTPDKHHTRLETTMKQGTKYSIGITSIVLAGTLGLGTMAVASGGDDGDRPKVTTEQRCEKQGDVAARAAAAKARIAAQAARFTEKLARAAAAGKTEKVAKIEKKIAKLAKLSERIDTRLAKFQAWAAVNCVGEPTTPTETDD